MERTRARRSLTARSPFTIRERAPSTADVYSGIALVASSSRFHASCTATQSPSLIACVRWAGAGCEDGRALGQMIHTRALVRQRPTHLRRELRRCDPRAEDAREVAELGLHRGAGAEKGNEFAAVASTFIE
eukprot:scaffold203085_cov30-Tisochrysis_lutea.AAC.4